MRDYFVALFKKHIPEADLPPSLDNIDGAILAFMNIAVAMHKAGAPYPHPSFVEACSSSSRTIWT